MEAEYVALENAVKESVSLEMMFDELKVLIEVEIPRLPYIIRCDNKSAIDFSVNKIERSTTRHIRVAYHITRKMYEEGLISLKYVSSGDNVTDILTNCK